VKEGAAMKGAGVVMSTTDLDRIIERMSDLPAMPEVVAEALSLTDDPNSDMEAVSRVIERDPALSARILRVSNSPYFGMRQHVGTLKLAMVVLGVREIRNIVLGISLFDALRDPTTDRILTERYWHDSFRVASLAKRLGADLALRSQGEDFIAGLLHGIGKMVLCRHLHDEFVPLFNDSTNDDDLAERERDAFGFSHADVAAALGKRWNLPETICDALWLHLPHPDKPLALAKDPMLAGTVRIAYYAGRDADRGVQAAVDAALAQTEAWEVFAAGGAVGLTLEERPAVLAAMVQEIADDPPPDFV